jgi:small subunit ribosomal protein S6
MREYELILVIHPDLDETAFNDLLLRISGWIKDDGGEVIKTDIWGKRELAYSIRKQKQGQYVLLHVKMPPQFGAQLERNLRFLEPVIRFMLTSK